MTKAASRTHHPTAHIQKHRHTRRKYTSTKYAYGKWTDTEKKHLWDALTEYCKQEDCGQSPLYQVEESKRERWKKIHAFEKRVHTLPPPKETKHRTKINTDDITNHSMLEK